MSKVLLVLNMQVIAEEIDQAAPVLGRADQLVAVGDTGVTFDGIQSQSQAPGSLAQSYPCLQFFQRS